MRAAADCRIVGRWRIVEADLWDREHLDLCGPAMLVVGDDGQGEIAFGALDVGLDLAYSRSMVSFTGSGHGEMDEATGDGAAELLDDGSREIEFSCHDGDEAILKPVREPSSTVCYWEHRSPKAVARPRNQR